MGLVMARHPEVVDGFDGPIKLLAKRVCEMRYDQLSLFFGYCAMELIKQSNADMRRGRKRLAVLLTASAGISSTLQSKLGEIVRLCAPHMKCEFSEKEMRSWETLTGKTRWWR